MAIVTISWQMVTPVAPGPTPGSTQVTISGGDPGFVPVTMSVTASPAVFPSIPAETTTAPYLATVQWMDSNSVALGSPQVAPPFSVAAPVPNLLGPGNVTVVVS
jgi:hypothetical protein